MKYIYKKFYFNRCKLVLITTLNATTACHQHLYFNFLNAFLFNQENSNKTAIALPDTNDTTYFLLNINFNFCFVFLMIPLVSRGNVCTKEQHCFKPSILILCI